MNLMHVRRFWLAGVVLAAVLALLPFSFHAERHLETATRIEGSEAGKVPQELATRFRSPFVDRVVLVIQGLPPADSEEGEQALATIEEGLQEEPGVSGVVSHLDFRDPIFLGKGGGTFVLVGLASTEGPVESLVPKLHELENSLQNQLRGRYPAVKLELTGETPLNFDIRKASADDVQHAESLVIPATLALLLVAFGSLVAALIPVAIGQLAIASALAIAGFLALHWHLSILVQNLSTMLGLGLGIDYALLMVSRFREAIAAEQNGLKASAIAARQAGRTLLISASTVAIGFLALLTVPISEVRSIGVAGFLVAGMSVLLANTLVPALLAALGPRINAGRLPFIASWDAHRAARTENRWRRWGKVIVAHPWLAIFLAGAPLLLLASQAARLDTSVPRGDWLPSAAESVRALHTLEQMDRVGIVYSLRVILELPTDSIAQTDAGWNALDRFSKRLASDPRSDRVISLTTIAESDRSGLGNLSRETRRTFLSRDGRAALIEVLTRDFRFPERSGQLGAGAAEDRRGSSHRSTRRHAAHWRHPGADCRLSDDCPGPVRFGNGAGGGRDAHGASWRLPIAFRRGEGHCSEPALGCGLLRSIGSGVSGRTRKFASSEFLRERAAYFPLCPSSPLPSSSD